MTADQKHPQRQEAIKQMMRLAQIATECAIALAEDELEDAIQHAIEIPDLALQATDAVRAGV